MIPIGDATPTRRVPLVNWLLIAVKVLAALANPFQFGAPHVFETHHVPIHPRRLAPFAGQYAVPVDLWR